MGCFDFVLWSDHGGLVHERIVDGLRLNKGCTGVSFTAPLCCLHGCSSWAVSWVFIVLIVTLLLYLEIRLCVMVV